MNDGNQYGLPNFDRPIETLLRQLVNEATGRPSIPLRVIDFHPAGRSVASAREAKVMLEVDGITQPYTLAARGRIKSREDVRAIVAICRRNP